MVIHIIYANDYYITRVHSWASLISTLKQSGIVHAFTQFEMFHNCILFNVSVSTPLKTNKTNTLYLFSEHSNIGQIQICTICVRICWIPNGATSKKTTSFTNAGYLEMLHLI